MNHSTTRRQFVAAAGATGLLAHLSSRMTRSQAAPRQGGTLRVAMTGDPPSLDLHQSADTIILLITAHIYETLFTWNARYEPVPLLVESYESSADGRVVQLRLRPDVPFHNGEMLGAADVVASIERWGRIVGLGKSLLEATEKIAAVDRMTVELRLARPFGTFAIALARGLQSCAIYPKSVLDRSNDVRLAEYVGTGPFRFESWQPDRAVRLSRFADYASPTGDQDGYAGSRTVHLDGIEFVPARDEAARIAGLQAGSYHYLESISPDQYVTFRDDPAIVTLIPPADSWLSIVLNMRSPLLADRRVRRALQLAVDGAPVLQAAFGDGFYTLAPALMPGAPAWESNAGSQFYNQRRPDEARQLLADASYAGEPLRLMTTREVLQEYNAALVAKQQWEAIGVTVDVQVYDGATLSDRRQEAELWDGYAAWASFRPDPILRNMSCTATGWWCDNEKDRLLAALQGEAEYEERVAAWVAVQEQFYEDVARVTFGHGRRLVAHAASLHAVGPTELQPDFANAWLDEGA